MERLLLAGAFVAMLLALVGAYIWTWVQLERRKRRRTPEVHSRIDLPRHRP